MSTTLVPALRPRVDSPDLLDCEKSPATVERVRVGRNLIVAVFRHIEAGPFAGTVMAHDTHGEFLGTLVESDHLSGPALEAAYRIAPTLFPKYV